MKQCELKGYYGQPLNTKKVIKLELLKWELDYIYSVITKELITLKTPQKGVEEFERNKRLEVNKYILKELHKVIH